MRYASSLWAMIGKSDLNIKAVREISPFLFPCAVFRAKMRFKYAERCHEAETMPELANERELLQKIHAEPEAFRQLYRHYFPRVYAYVAYRVGRRQDAEDVVAEVFVNMVAGLKHFEYRGAGSFAAWLFRIAHNQVNQFYRDVTINQQISLDEIPDVAVDALPPDQALMRRENFAHLFSMITALAPRRQEIITLKFFAGLRNQEIAAVLNLDERTVASHLSRALDDLRSQYELEKEHES